MTFSAELWLYPGKGGWHFVTLPIEIADEIRARTAAQRRGFGSARVKVTLGTSSWETSVFPDTKSSSYVLPVKAEVRRREGVDDGDTVTVALELR